MFLRAEDAPRNVGHSPKWFTSPTRKCRNMFTRIFKYKKYENAKTTALENGFAQGKSTMDILQVGSSPPPHPKNTDIRKYKLSFFYGQKMHFGHSPGLGPPSNANATHCSEIHVCKYWHLMALAVEGTPHIMTGVLLMKV